MIAKANSSIELPELFSRLHNFKTEILPMVKLLGESNLDLPQTLESLNTFYPLLVDYPLIKQKGIL